MMKSLSCMFCNQPTSIDKLGKCLSKNMIKIIRDKYIFESFVEKCKGSKINIIEENSRKIKLQKELKVKNDEKNKLQKQLKELRNDISHIKNKINFPEIYNDNTSQYTRIAKCCNSTCTGYIDNYNWCATCDHTTCHECFETFPHLQTHVCDPETKSNVSIIMKESKPCPACGTYISKIDGCDQMWCTSCNHGFNWISSLVLKINARFHNPHYFTHMENTTDDEINYIISKQPSTPCIKYYLTKKLDNAYNIKNPILNMKLNALELAYHYTDMKSYGEYVKQQEEKIMEEYILNYKPIKNIKKRILFMYNRNESYNQLMTIYKKFIINATDCLKSFKFYCKKYNIERIHKVIENVKIVNDIYNDEIVNYRKHFDASLEFYEIDNNGFFII